MALFPLGRGGGDGVAHGYKGKGVTNHLLIEENGLPLALTSTPANGDERQQVAILLGRVKVYHGYGRPRSCPKESFRWEVERCHAWLQRKFRRLTTRWERRSKY